MTKPWVHLPAVSRDRKRGRWTAIIRTPGARCFHRLRAATYPEIIVLYLAHAFDRESLIAAAEKAEPRVTMMRRVNAIRYRHKRKEEAQ